MKTSHARGLRRISTDVEMKLWQKLRSRQLDVDFRRQHPVGNFVLDFYAPSIGLVVEVDGGQHADPRHVQSDEARTRWLVQRGVTMLRFWNSDVSHNLSGVLEVIATKIAELKASGAAPVRRWNAKDGPS